MNRYTLVVASAVVFMLLLAAVLLGLVIIEDANAQAYEMYWWSVPYGNQTTCGIDDGIAFEQTHFYEWSGEKPQWIYIYVTGPHTYDFESGVFIPHYRVTDVFPHDWEWYTDHEDYRERWIRGRLPDEYWNDSVNRTTTPIGYKIELHRLEPGNYVADHHIAAWYGFSPMPTENAGASRYNANDCIWFPVYLPIILK